MSRTAVVLSVALAFTAGDSFAADLNFQVIDLGTGHRATGLNNKGEVVGFTGTPGLGTKDGLPEFNVETFASKWTLSTGWVDVTGAGQTHAAYTGIDDKSNTIGIVRRTDERMTYRAFYRTRGGKTTYFPDANHDSWVVAMLGGNVAGTLANVCNADQPEPCSTRAALQWNPASGLYQTHLGPYWLGFTNLGSSATAITANGQVLGNRGYSYPLQNGPAWWDRSLVDCSDGELGTCAATYPSYGHYHVGGYMEAVNKAGLVVGWTTSPTGGNQSMTWNLSRVTARSDAPKPMTGAGTAGDTDTRAYGVNAKGQAVGRSWGGPLGTHAFVWTKSTGTLDLKAVAGISAWVVQGAHAINDKGWILAYGLPAVLMWPPHQLLLIPE